MVEVVVEVVVGVGVGVGVGVVVEVVVGIISKTNKGDSNMKKLVTVTEVESEGLDGLMGEIVTLFCMNYIYTGKLTGVNEKYVKLEDAGIVYETGSLCDKSWKDMQKLPHSVYVMQSAIESFMILK